MKITIEIPETTFAVYKKAAELVQKRYPFINPAQATTARLFEMLILADLPDVEKIKSTVLAKKFIKAVNRTHNAELEDDPEDDEMDAVLNAHPAQGIK
jgi:hypothetical protein